MRNRSLTLLIAGGLFSQIGSGSMLLGEAAPETIQFDLDAARVFADADAARALSEVLYGPDGPPADSAAGRLMADDRLFDARYGSLTMSYGYHPGAAISGAFLTWAEALGLENHGWDATAVSRINFQIELVASLGLNWSVNFSDATLVTGVFHDTAEDRRPARFFRKLGTFRLYVADEFRALILPMGTEQAYEAILILPNHPWRQVYDDPWDGFFFIIDPQDDQPLPNAPRKSPPVVPLEAIMEQLDASLLRHVRSHASERTVAVSLPQANGSLSGDIAAILPDSAGLAWMGAVSGSRIVESSLSARDTLDLEGWKRTTKASVEILLPWNPIGVDDWMINPEIKVHMPVPPMDFIADHPFALLVVESASGRVVAFQPKMRASYLPHTTAMPPVSYMDTGWMGTVFKRDYPWFHEQNRGFFYAETLQASGTHAYRPHLGWVFFNADHPQILYSYQRNGWLFEIIGKRRFYDFRASAWFELDF